MKKLLLQEVDVNLKDENGQTPIFIACREGKDLYFHLSIAYNEMLVI